MSERVLAQLDEVWSSIEEVCAMLTPAQWARPTDLPGWSVQDHVAHLCGIESMLLKRPQPAPLEKPWPAHVRNEIGALNEAHLNERRGMAPEEILCEFLELTAERLKILADYSDEQWKADTQGVLGVAPMHEVVEIRMLDSFYHEQDIRRAINQPGNLDGDVAATVVRRMAQALPMVVGKRAKLPDGTSVVFDIQGPAGGVIAYEMRNGKAVKLDAPPDKPTTVMKMNVETFLCALGGRWNAEKISKHVRVDGIANVANNIVESMNVMI
ncbi:MAG: maleylpyruvate isomerase family mycothiol-dependent enzyme [Actinomycetota bacterium]